MSEVAYTANIRIDRVKGPLRHAYLPATPNPVEFGVHGAIKAHYGLDDAPDLPLPVDYIAAAVGT